MGNTAGLKRAMVTLWGEGGQWAADTFDAHNREYFGGEVPFAGVVWGLTPHGDHLGHTYSSGRITLHPSLASPSGEDPWKTGGLLGEGYASDVLLHEMIHALLFSRGHGAEHNAAPWCAEVVRLAAALGLGEVRAAPVTPRRVEGKVARVPLPGHLSRDTIARFPHTLRPAGYYAGHRRRFTVLI